MRGRAKGREVVFKRCVVAGSFKNPVRAEGAMCERARDEGEHERLLLCDNSHRRAG